MKKRILVADDDTAIVDALQMMLDFEGYDVKTAIDGAEVRALKNHLPDLILLDIWMSGDDGQEICRLLKSQKHTRHIPIILISASKEVEKSAREAGADDFISKPFEMAELLHKVDMHFKNI